jgi:hypothetical protein
MNETERRSAKREERRDDPPPQPVRGPEQPPGEVNGPRGPEPTRFGDWERAGRCSDF